MPVRNRKVTIKDVAKRAGVSISGVSYAINGKDGISQEKREAVFRAVKDLGWKPNTAARALPQAQMKTVGMIFKSTPQLTAVEPYSMELFAGISEQLELHDYSLITRIAPNNSIDLAICDDWIVRGAVDGIILMNMELGDRRLDFFRKNTSMPTVFISGRLIEGTTCLYMDNTSDMAMIMDYLYNKGHRIIARVAGSEKIEHTIIRDKAFVEYALSRKIDFTILHSDYMPESGYEVTTNLLTSAAPPTAIIYDNDLTALTGMGAALAMGIAVPKQLSVVSWENSYICSAAIPGITALDHHVFQLGQTAAQMIIRLINGEVVESQQGPKSTLIKRSSTTIL